jgi:hypothetical protein
VPGGSDPGPAPGPDYDPDPSPGPPTEGGSPSFPGGSDPGTADSGASPPARDDGSTEGTYQDVVGGGSGVGPAVGPARDDVDVSQRIPPSERATDAQLRETIRQQAAQDSSLTPGEIRVTGFERAAGEVVPVIRRRDEAERGPADVPGGYREQIRSDAASEFGAVSEEETAVTVEDGEIGVTFSASAQERQRRSRAAERFDQQFPSIDISTEDIQPTDDGRYTVDENVATQIANTRRQFGDELGGDAVGVTGGSVEQQTDQRRQQPENEPGALSTIVGSAGEAVDDSPAGEALDEGRRFLFGDYNNRQDGLAGRIDQTLANVETAYRENLTNRIGSADRDIADAQSYGSVRPFGITGEDAQETTVQFTQFLNPGTLGRDIITLAESGARTAELVEERGPEGAQILQERAVGTARGAPGAARDLAETVAENPREAARTTAALTATFGAGAVASRAVRTGASAASRGTRAAASGAGDVASSAGRRAARFRDRAPDVTVRQDADAPAIEVDPLLRQQARNVARGDADLLSTPSISSSSLSSRIGRTIERTRASARQNADSVTSAVRDRTPSRDILPSRGSDSDASLARRAGRATRSAELNARLNADIATSAARDALPDRSTLSGRDVLSGSDGSLARQAGRATRLAELRTQLRAQSALAQARQAAPSRPSGLGFSDSETSLARRAGRRFETERQSLQLAASAAPSAARERAVGAVESAAESARGSIPRVNTDRSFDLSAPSFSAPRPDRRVRSAVSGITDTTIRIGPARPGRTDVRVGDLELDFDRFDDDVDLDLRSGAGGRTDFDADVDAGRGSGSGQLTQLRASRRSETDVDLDARVRSRARSRSGPDTESRDGLLASSLTAGGGALSDTSTTDGAASRLRESQQPSVTGEEAGTQSPVDVTGVTSTGSRLRSGAGVDVSSPLRVSTQSTPAIDTSLRTQSAQTPVQTAEISSTPSRGRPRFSDMTGNGDSETSSFGSLTGFGEVVERDLLNPFTGR